MQAKRIGVLSILSDTKKAPLTLLWRAKEDIAHYFEQFLPPASRFESSRTQKKAPLTVLWRPRGLR